jgi:hypothetical protein
MAIIIQSYVGIVNTCLHSRMPRQSFAPDWWRMLMALERRVHGEPSQLPPQKAVVIDLHDQSIALYIDSGRVRLPRLLLKEPMMRTFVLAWSLIVDVACRRLQSS